MPALIIGALLPFIAAAVTGNLSIPHNDSWAYSQIAQDYVRTGHLHLDGWIRGAFIGQFVVLGPLASSITAQQSFVALLSLIGLACVFDLLRPVIGERRAGITALLLAFWPGYALLSTSFMTDVPTLAVVFIGLAIGRRALERDSLSLFTLAMVVGFWGTTIRAQALAAPAALLIQAAMTRRDRKRVRLGVLAVFAVALGVGFVYFNAWFEALPRVDAAPSKIVPALLGTTLNMSLHAFFMVALPAAPAVLWAARPARWRRPAKITSIVMAGVAICALHDYGRSGFFVGNYLQQGGAYSAVMHGDSVVIPNVLWDMTIVVAMVSGALLAGLLVENASRGDRLMTTFTLLFAAGTLGTFLVGQFMFDRYFLECLPGVLAIVLIPGPAPAPRGIERRFPGFGRWPRWMGVSTAGLTVSIVAFMLFTSAMTRDSQRWAAAESLHASGVPTMRINAGLEWLGLHAPNAVINRNPDTADRPLGYFTTTPACYTFTVSPTDQRGWTLYRVVEYEQFLVTGSTKLYIYATHASGCPALVK